MQDTFWEAIQFTLAIKCTLGITHYEWSRVEWSEVV